ncbi:hypothetical protein ACFE04_010576 [Oxalis oulophora]
MAITTSTTNSFSQLSTNHHHRYNHRAHNSNISSFTFITSSRTTSKFPSFSLSSASTTHLKKLHPTVIFSSGGGDGGSIGGGGDGDDGGSGDDGHHDGEDDKSRNKAEAFLAMAEGGRSLESLPKDLAAAVEAGRIPGSIVHKYFDLEKSPISEWLLQIGGFKERLLADDLFLTKVAIECGMGIFTKTAAEIGKRKENFMKELDFVFADVVMAFVADFMLVWLPAPTISLRQTVAVNAGPLAKFFYGCPENAFQIAFGGTSYSLLQRIGAIVLNGAKLFAVGSSASVIGVGVTNLLIKARKALDKSFSGEVEDLPIIPTSIAYGTYMSVSSNIRYQFLAGVIEQRMLEPLLHKNKLLLGAICFAVRTGNTYLGSILWVDFARLLGIQKIRD